MSSPVIFLDFDDVLCMPADGKAGAYDIMLALHDARMDIKNAAALDKLWINLFDDAAVSSLRHIHDEFDPLYVLSTSWTRFLDKESLALVLHKTGLTFVVEALHSDWETNKVSGTTRAQQISSWLGHHPEVTQWLALDDEFSGTGLNSVSSNVVLCSGGEGFTQSAFKQAWTILQGLSHSYIPQRE